MTYLHRALEARVRDALAVMPAVFVNGPRQAGKSTLARHLAGTGFDAHYVTFDDIGTFAAASQDPEAFLRSFAKPVIIDEVQMVPAILRTLKLLIDEFRAADKSGANGRFLLTGSANVLALPGLAEALVGRMAVLSLYPLSASETMGHARPVINGWFDQSISFSSGAKADAIALDRIVHRATFPEISAAPGTATTVWFNGYLTALLQRDVKQLAEIEKIPALPNVVKVLASRAGGLLNDADCARDAKLNTMTYRRYRSLLQQLFLIMLVPPWHRNIGKRVVKSPKLFFTDTALLCHELGVDAGGLRQQNPGLFGRVLENFVASELAKQLTAMSDGSLHHFRTTDGHEVDFVVERRNGKLLGIEVKAGSSVAADDFAGLKKLKEQAGKDFVRGIVLYLGKIVVPFGDDMFAMPLDGLWRFNMKVTSDEEVNYAGGLEACVLWADYGDKTRVRCLISRETIHDYFHDRASEKQAEAAVRKHWNVIWTALERKITEGRIEMVLGGNPPQKIQQVMLEARDFGGKDFRKRREIVARKPGT